MAQQIGNFGLAAAVFSLTAMAGQFTWSTFFVDGQSWDYKYLSDYLRFIITAITILVCFPALAGISFFHCCTLGLPGTFLPLN
jgi:hypothetical protein